MLSTVDSIVAAIAYTASRDISRTDSLPRVRVWTIGIIGSGLILYPVLRTVFGASLPVFLYAAYSAQLALIVVVSRAYQEETRSAGRIRECALGIVAAVLCAILVARIPNAPDASVLSPVFAVLGSVLGYIFTYRRSASTDQTITETSAP